jgi:PqqD family protein of HPr-rel-A system
MSTQAAWRLAHAITWRELDGEIVVYHDGTGNTHHLGSLGGAVLRALAGHASGAGFETLIQELCVDEASYDAVAADVERTLGELAALKLAVPIAA